METLDDKLRTLAESGWLSLVSRELRSRVIDACVTREAKKGDVLWRVGDETNGLYCLLSGSIRVEAAQTRHGPAMLTIFHAVSWIGEAEILAGTGRITTMTVLRNTSLLFLPTTRVLALSKTYPEIWRGLGYLATDHLYTAVAGLNDLTIRSSADRLAAILLRLCGARVPGFPNPRILDLDVTQSELAQLCNLSRSVIADHLDDFERCGQIEMGYGRLRILDAKSLADRIGLSLADTVD